MFCTCEEIEEQIRFLEKQEEVQRRFYEHLDRLGRVGIVHRLRQVHKGCWDWEAADRGLRLLDDVYQELLFLPWEDVLNLLES